MNYFKIAWNLISSRPAIALAAVLAGWMLAGHVGNWRAQQKLETVAQELERTKDALRAERGKLTREEAAALCEGLQPIVAGKALETSRKRRSSTAAPVAPARGGEFSKLAGGLEDQLLDVLKVPAMPYGGEAEITLGQGDAAPVVTVYPDPRPWLEVGSRWRAAALVGAPLDGGGSGKLLVVPSIDWFGARTGFARHGAGVAYCPAKAVVGGYRLSIE